MPAPTKPYVSTRARRHPKTDRRAPSHAVLPPRPTHQAIAIREFASVTEAVTQDLTVPGFGTPSGVIIIAGAVDVPLDRTAEARYSIWMSDGTTHFESQLQAEDSTTPTNGDVNLDGTNYDNAVRILTESLGYAAQAKFDSFITDGVRIDWYNGVPPSDPLRIFVIFFRSDVQCKVVKTTPNAGAVTGVGFRPQAGFVCGVGYNGSRSDATLHMGWMGEFAGVIYQGCVAHLFPQGYSGYYPASKLYSDKIAAELEDFMGDDASETWAAAISAVGNDGFTIGATGSYDASDEIGCLLFNRPGYRAWVGVIDMPSADGEVDYSTGMRPEFLSMIYSLLPSADSLAQTYGDSEHMGIGFSDNLLQANIGYLTRYSGGANDTATFARQQLAHAYDGYSGSPTKRIDAWHVSNSDTGFRLRWDVHAAYYSRKQIAFCFGPLGPEYRMPRVQYARSALHRYARTDEGAIELELRQQSRTRTWQSPIVTGYFDILAAPLKVPRVQFSRSALSRHARTIEGAIELELRQKSRTRTYRNESFTGAFVLGFDALRIYGTGAASEGDAQTSEGANLGGKRASTEWPALAIFGAVPDLTLHRVSEAHAEGLALIQSDGAGRYRYTAPGSGTPGAFRSVAANGVRVILADGADITKAIAVSRVNGAAAAPAGEYQIKLLEIYNGAYGLDNVTDAERAAGDDEYRGFILRNEGLGAVSLALYLQELAAEQVVDASGYAASGAISIGTKGTFKAWPPAGWVKNDDTGEVMYYTGRSSTALTVPALGRDLYTDVAGGAAGSEDDTLRCISPLRIATEAAAGDGTIQAVANENTAPGGVTWQHPAGPNDAAVIAATIESGGRLGLWLHRKIVSGMSGIGLVRSRVVIDSTEQGALYRHVLRGRFRVAEDALVQYELYRGVDADPDFSAAPWQTFTSLPFETPALTTDAITKLVLRQRNKYNLLSRNLEAQTFVIDAGGAEVNPPSAPYEVRLDAAANGAGRVRAYYEYYADAASIRADTWAVWITTDGSDPDPSTAATYAVAMAQVDGVAFLDWTTGTNPNGTTVKAIVRARRAGTPNVDSQNADVYEITADANAPATPTGGVFLGENARQD